VSGGFDENWHYVPERELPDDIVFDWDRYIETLEVDADGYALETLGSKAGEL
jgi:hypothetical protein